MKVSLSAFREDRQTWFGRRLSLRSITTEESFLHLQMALNKINELVSIRNIIGKKNSFHSDKMSFSGGQNFLF